MLTGLLTAPVLRGSFVGLPEASGAQRAPSTQKASPKTQSRSNDAAWAAPLSVGVVAVGFSARCRRRGVEAAALQKRRSGRHLVARGAGFDEAAWRGGFQVAPPPQLEDNFYVVGAEAAQVPADLVGTWFWVAPGQFKVVDSYVSHPLDGDGLVLALTFDSDGKVLVRHRLVQTQGVYRDNTLEKNTTNGVHGTQGEGWGPLNIRNSIKNPANINAYWYEERLLATWPYGPPYNIDPGSLGTIIGGLDSGASDLGGLLEQGDPLYSYCPTPKLDPKGTIVSYGLKPELVGTRILLYENREGWRSRYPKAFPRTFAMSGYFWVTDIAATPRWAVLAVPPCKADVLAAASGAHPSKVLSWDENASGKLIFATRDKQQSKEVSIDVDGLVVEGFVNAFEAEGDSSRVTVDVVEADRWEFAPKAPEGASAERPFWEVLDPKGPRTRIVRYEVDLKAEKFTRKVILDRHVSKASVSLSKSGSSYRYAFCGVAHGEDQGPIGGVCKVDVESGSSDTWVASPTEFCGAPTFVPKPGASGEDEGYLVTMVLDGASRRSDIVVLDAQDVAKGPVSRFSLREAMPHSLGGAAWAEGLTFTEDELTKKYTLLNMFARKAKEWNDFNSSASLAPGANMLFMKQGGKMR